MKKYELAKKLKAGDHSPELSIEAGEKLSASPTVPSFFTTIFYGVIVGLVMFFLLAGEESIFEVVRQNVVYFLK